MIICTANLQAKQIGHLKFGADMVQTLLAQHGGAVVPGRHSLNSTECGLVERHFPERNPSAKRNPRSAEG